MDETGWLKASGPRGMLRYLRIEHNAARTKIGRRKLRLFQVACYRQVWDVLPEPIRVAVEKLERIADGQESEKGIVALRHQAGQLLRKQVSWTFSYYCAEGLFAATSTASLGVTAGRVSTILTHAQSLAESPHAKTHPHLVRSRTTTSRRHAELVRELFGNPFRPSPQRKFPAEVLGLAQASHDDHAHYPVLADALADLGEEAAAAHCRQPNHLEGCHVVDWILGRH